MQQSEHREESTSKIEREEEVIILDFLKHGYTSDRRPSHMKTAIAQGIGTKFFTLLELVPRKDVDLQPYATVYIGEGKRDKIHHINGKLTLDKLTPTARSELEYVLKDLMEKRQEQFIEFFNTAQPLSTRMHQLQLLPGLGSKHMWEIVEERKVEPFKSFDDIKKRVKLMPDPKKMVLRRIILELSGQEKHKIFVR